MRPAAGMSLEHADDAPAVDRNQIKGARAIECNLVEGAPCSTVMAVRGPIVSSFSLSTEFTYAPS
jgi:hypothetical protein